MKKIIITFLIVTLSASLLFAQENKNETPKSNHQKSNFWKQVQFGGGLTLNVYGRTTVLGLAPSAIYNFNDKFGAGMSVSYLYIKNRNDNNPINTYGASVMAVYRPIKMIQLSSEFEQSYLTRTGSASRSIPALYLGVAYTAGRNIAVGMRYDVLYDETKSLYPSAFTPFVRVFF